MVRTNAVLGARLAEALDVEWRPAEHTTRNRVTLDGLNTLLEGATEAYQQGSLRQVASLTPPSLLGPGWAVFNPAVSKIEAVTRIARLTDAPEEWLGPGSKEHKSVLTNLADRVLPDAELDRSSKTRLARDIARVLDVTWTDSCYSTGETISLEGLNLILAGAERHLGRLGVTAAELLADPQAEGRALVAALYDGWPGEAWQARSKVEWMQRRGVRGANDNEWQGWYYEARGRELLNAAFPPSREPVRTRYGNTVFDYSLNYVWDLKAHTEQQLFPHSGRRGPLETDAMLNDEQATRDCVEEQGIGFLVLSGSATMDEDGRFVAWHRWFKAKHGGKPSAPSNSGRSRMRKAAFAPLSVEAFWVANTPALHAAITSGQLKAAGQGRQAPRNDGEEGAPRRPKFTMHVPRARPALLVGHRDWTYTQAEGAS
ncbi:MAG: hypothetical protein ACRYG2_20835 [Janthinobacterium lividum]